MKVFEILRNDASPISEQEVVRRLRTFDWSYEFSGDTHRYRSGARQLELLENMVYELWKIDKDVAVRAWNDNAPDVQDKTATPSFIFRLEAQGK